MREHMTVAATRPPDKPLERPWVSVFWFEPPVFSGAVLDEEVDTAIPLPDEASVTEYDLVTAAPWVLTRRNVPASNVSEALFVSTSWK